MLSNRCINAIMQGSTDWITLKRLPTVWHKGVKYTRETENRWYPYRDGAYPEHPNSIGETFRPIR